MKTILILGAGTAGTAYLTKRGIRDKTELVYATPLDGAFSSVRSPTTCS
jgi:hypothetical protein